MTEWKSRSLPSNFETLSLSNVPVGPSCLRSSSKKTSISRNVSFPDDESQIVTGVLETAHPWECVENVTADLLTKKYLESCERHNTQPIQSVLSQIKALNFNIERNECFDLKGVYLNNVDCESLEEILKRVQFQTINVEATGLNDEAAIALFDMLDFYESAFCLNISSNNDIGVRGWQACARMLKKSKCLEILEARNTILSEQSMHILGRALRFGCQLCILKLENCNLSDRTILSLASSLKYNSTLKELYLAENYLNENDALPIANLLKCNTTLELLDLSNNNIQNKGFKIICESIINQNSSLTILICWNNNLDQECSETLANLIDIETKLEMLNIGYNCLLDSTAEVIKIPMKKNKNILRLGLQSTQITCRGAQHLSEILEVNESLQRLDLRDNNIQIKGIKSLKDSVMKNRRITRLDIDPLPRINFAVETTKEYTNLLDTIKQICLENESKNHNKEIFDDILDEKSDETNITKSIKIPNVDSRKISLTCESLMMQYNSFKNPNFLGSDDYLSTTFRGSSGRLRSPAPSPIHSPIATSPACSPSITSTRNRFQVSKVSEQKPKENRFKVTRLNDKAPTASSESLSDDSFGHTNLELTVDSLDLCKKKNIDKRKNQRTRKVSWVMGSRPLLTSLQNITSSIDQATTTGVDKLLSLFSPFSSGDKSSTSVDTVESNDSVFESELEPKKPVNLDQATWPPVFGSLKKATSICRPLSEKGRHSLSDLRTF
ncbi:protein phosphatase 1 regulatory subunit 37 isoform X9 [Daktulosphaira vitifoliae]|nr:protein phosphatase 1 regulatory subunit 37 isoform X8 [Daktulosphaira vitifoliae]XP_050535975.1 protein phosphatase 1 regulatory subunit 37 isoform X8 [Daktulosphaira vitifoliae]XP_050535976.1 protein phosphatase 1 regulatory subunit 37 isoform X8 [Daktulosphaira vitifoliae]XP_050535977.1 protein phosphatase 1 regulatory subunit 37 isoform X8 [Daktulosphaira vitifoliae]XP_050535979.1 protein phosphatase 1 regulatory subunit 37 isoform X9 [Daktulosphaira vitifoliae]XP_050535980.1 protein ph